jgi:hypothetical protein
MMNTPQVHILAPLSNQNTIAVVYLMLDYLRRKA